MQIRPLLSCFYVKIDLDVFQTDIKNLKDTLAVFTPIILIVGNV